MRKKGNFCGTFSKDFTLIVINGNSVLENEIIRN